MIIRVQWAISCQGSECISKGPVCFLVPWEIFHLLKSHICFIYLYRRMLQNLVMGEHIERSYRYESDIFGRLIIIGPYFGLYYWEVVVSFDVSTFLWFLVIGKVARWTEVRLNLLDLSWGQLANPPFISYGSMCAYVYFYFILIWSKSFYLLTLLSTDWYWDTKLILNVAHKFKCTHNHTLILRGTQRILHLKWFRSVTFMGKNTHLVGIVCVFYRGLISR